jgi:cytochrome c553
MKAHFGEVSAVHEAVIRGDLAAARAAANRLAAHDYSGLPAVTRSYQDTVKQLAGQVTAAKDVKAAATATAYLVGVCGDCHRAAGVVPAPALPERPAVGETVGHMLDHQRAVDALMQGLAVPSPSLWNQGAQGLRVAPLRSSKLPKDPKLTDDIVGNERRVHQLADQAAGTTEPQARAALYGEILTTCANCHSLHANIWGPSKR